MPERLQMVVGGQRQTALPTPLDIPKALCSGFLMEKHRLSSLELPDHWIPSYLVGLQFVRERGKRSFFDGGKQHEHPIEDGDCVLTAPREVRRFRIEGVATAIIVSIEPLVLHEMIAGSSSCNPFELIRTWNGQDPTLRSLVLRLQAEVAAGGPSGSLLADSICTRLAEELIQRYSIGRVRLNQLKGGLSGLQLRRALEYIDEGLGLNLTANGIARVAGLSKYHFGKAFKQSTGMTLHSYVLARRMRRSQQLLVTSDLPLVTVAEEAGFSNQSHFTTVFSTRIGITPRSYRDVFRPYRFRLARMYGLIRLPLRASRNYGSLFDTSVSLPAPLFRVLSTRASEKF